MGITAFPFTAVIDVPTARILGRDDAGTGSAEALTNTEVFAILATGTPSASTYLRGDGTWATVSAGISSLNGLTDATQTFALGTTGTDVSFASAAGVHTLNIPNASATARGVVTTGSQTFAGAKTFSSRVTVPSGTLATPSMSFGVDLDSGIYQGGSDGQIRFVSNTVETFALTEFIVVVYVPLRVSSITSSTHVVEMVSGTNAQTFRVYNTFTSSTSFERLNLSWASNVCYIGTEKGSAGGTARDLTLGTDGAVRLVLPAATTSGALYLGPRADNTATGGNARGANAVDLQTSRTAAANVASGTGSAILGGDGGGRASGSHAVSLGGGVATAQGAVAGGGTREGMRSTASGVASAAFCGGNASSDDCFSVGWGSSSTGAYGSISLGNIARSTGGRGSLATGQESLADRQSQTAHSAGQFSAQGDAQRVEFVLRNKTTTNSAVTLFLNGSSQRLTIPSGKILHATVHILGSKSDGTAVASYVRQVTIKNVGGTTSLVGTVNTIGVDEAAGTSIAITADDTNDALQIAVTGVLNETWRWVAVVYGVELAYGT